jgi:hypothetical protein
MIIQTQTTQQKRDAYAAFLQRMVEQGVQPLADDVHNYTLLTNYIEQMGQPVQHDSMVKAINANTQLLHWLPSKAEQERQQQAAVAKKQHDAEVDRILDSFCAEHPEFLRCDENLNLLVKFCREQHGGTIGDVQIRHFWRIFQDSPEIVKRATNTPTIDPAVMWMKQNKVYSLEDGRRDREAANAAKKKKFDSDMATARDRATFEGEMKAVRRHVVMARIGQNYPQTVTERIARLEVLATRYPQWQSEVAAEVQRQKQTLRF